MSVKIAFVKKKKNARLFLNDRHFHSSKLRILVRIVQTCTVKLPLNMIVAVLSLSSL